MINSIKELQVTLNMDAKAMGIKRYSFRNLFGRAVWKYIKILRIYEYLICAGYPRFIRLIFGYVHHRQGIKLGFDIPPCVVDSGLRINHYGLIIISPLAKIGKWADIHQGVNIGVSTDGRAPRIGNNVFIGPGAKIFGEVIIADNCAIGANAVVNKSFHETGISIAGNPAKKISDKGNPYLRGDDFIA